MKIRLLAVRCTYIYQFIKHLNNHKIFQIESFSQFWPNFSWVVCSVDYEKCIFGHSLQKMVNNHHWDIKRDTYQVPRDLLSLKNPNSRTPKLVNCQGFWKKNRSFRTF